MKDRRHHNTKGRRQIKSNASFRRLVYFARQLGLKVEGENEVEQLKGDYPNARKTPRR